MKKKVSDFVKIWGGQTAYSGKSKTMFIKGDNADQLTQQVIDWFGYSLPFKLG